MTKRLKIEKGSGNVFADIGFPPEEAQSLRLRADLMIEVGRYVKKSGLTQKEAAKRLGVTQRRLNMLLMRKIEPFSLEDLVSMVVRAGMQVELTVRKAAQRKLAASGSPPFPHRLRQPRTAYQPDDLIKLFSPPAYGN